MKKLMILAAILAMAFAAPALAQTGAGQDGYQINDQYEDQPPPPAEEPGEEGQTETIRGVITEVSGSSVRVEGSSSADACGAAILELGEGTEVFFVRGGTVPATAEDLRVGQTVDANYAVPEGPRTLECPQTYEALQIFILPYGFDIGTLPEDPGAPPAEAAPAIPVA